MHFCLQSSCTTSPLSLASYLPLCVASYCVHSGFFAIEIRPTVHVQLNSGIYTAVADQSDY